MTQIPADEHIRLGGLTPGLRLEVQYALQCRADERATKTPPPIVAQVVRDLIASGVTSVLALTEAQWRQRMGRSK